MISGEVQAFSVIGQTEPVGICTSGTFVMNVGFLRPVEGESFGRGSMYMIR